ncbi:MAG: MarR family transcriptional regulator [Oscillospiraceae bacterium]|nr:MarR family transcriptional regulator [Oscillospiraceae bacterium]
MAEFDNLKLDNQLCFPLYATARSVVNLYTPFLKPLGLTYTQYLVFLVLWEQDGISVGELCSKLYLDSGTITPLLKKMEEKGYIERRRSHEDERVVSVFLTEKGHDLRNEAKNIPTNVGQCIHLEPDEAVCLYSLLYKILGQKNQ